MVAVGREIARLRAFGRARQRLAESAGGPLCELCSAPVPEQGHEHLWAPARRELSCVCAACAALFPETAAPAEGAPARLRVRPRGRALEGAFSQACWDAVGVPVRLAFFRRTAEGAVIATLPSAAGSIETPVSEEAWGLVCAACPGARDLAPETEILLASGLGAPRLVRASIDLGFSLLGALRRPDGGDRARIVARFFEEGADS
jgi:hypothetical protein